MCEGLLLGSKLNWSCGGNLLEWDTFVVLLRILEFLDSFNNFDAVEAQFDSEIIF